MLFVYYHVLAYESNRFITFTENKVVHTHAMIEIFNGLFSWKIF